MSVKKSTARPPEALAARGAPEYLGLGIPWYRGLGLVVATVEGPDGPTLAADPAELPEAGGWSPLADGRREWRTKERGRERVRVAVPGVCGRLVGARQRWQLPDKSYAPIGSATPGKGWRRQLGLLMLGAPSAKAGRVATLVELQAYGLAATATVVQLQARLREAGQTTGLADLTGLVWAVRPPGEPGGREWLDPQKLGEQAAESLDKVLVPHLSWALRAHGESDADAAQALEQLDTWRASAAFARWRSAWGAE